MNLEAELVYEATVKCGDIQVIGDTPEGYKRIITITGGSFAGPNIKGEVLSGGADWQNRTDSKVHVFAKYTLKTDDGEFISIENEGFIDPKDPSSYIKTVPKFAVQNGSKYEFLRTGVFVGSLTRKECEEFIVEMKIYKLK